MMSILPMNSRVTSFTSRSLTILLPEYQDGYMEKYSDAVDATTTQKDAQQNYLYISSDIISSIRHLFSTDDLLVLICIKTVWIKMWLYSETCL